MPASAWKEEAYRQLLGERTMDRRVGSIKEYLDAYLAEGEESHRGRTDSGRSGLKI